jgi:hypothetical protein
VPRRVAGSCAVMERIRAAVPRSMAAMSGKPKVQVAREHLTKARDEAAGGDVQDAVQWGFASLEAAIDALAGQRNIAIEQKHWRRAEAAQQLHQDRLLPKDLSGLPGTLNEARKAVFYLGEEPDLRGRSIDDALDDIEEAVSIAEAEAK